MPVFPLADTDRENLVQQLVNFGDVSDPLSFVQRVFKGYPDQHISRIPREQPFKPEAFYRAVVKYCEVSAWSDEPPLMESLLRAFEPIVSFQAAIDAIRKEGPFRCHPRNQPYYVCRVAIELPLLARLKTRAAGIRFNLQYADGQGPPWRVLRVFGPPASGKSYTLQFFRYLSAIQPSNVGVLHVDFGDQEMVTQAAAENIPIELYLARQLEQQVRHRRLQLRGSASVIAAGILPDLFEIDNIDTRMPHIFPELKDQQRTRWAKELANELVDQVLGVQSVPSWWVAIFDNCERASAEAAEFVRRLVERAAGTPDTAENASKGPLRVVLLGDSDTLLPNPIYQGHIADEDLHNQTLGKPEVMQYFQILRISRRLPLDDPRVEILADQSVARAQELVSAAQQPLPWPRALATAVIEKTLPFEALAERKRSQP